MKRKERLTCLLLTAALLIPLSAQAAAAEYSDLPTSHWAYDDMDRAAALSIINGVGEGYMAPDDTLTWGQYLVMLDRAFYSEAYSDAVADGLAWDQAGHWAALESGLLLEDDFLPVDDTRLGEPILRRDAAVLLDRVTPEDVTKTVYWWDTSEPTTAKESFSDWAALPKSYQSSVSRLFDLSVVRGRDDGTFGGEESIKRADGTVLLIRVLDLVDQSMRHLDKTVTLHIVDKQGNVLAPDQTVTTKVGTWTGNLLDSSAVPGYTYEDGSIAVSSACSEYTLIFRPHTKFEAAEAEFFAQLERGEVTWDDYWSQDFWLYAQGESSRKHLLLFGNEETRRFSSQQEAAANMTTITVPVWRLGSSGNKVSSSASFSIHAAIADDVAAIFTEIYNDPEQFPIRDLGGYSWRGDSATGEHNCGTAIDLNANENYQVRDGQAMVGSFWMPGQNPYSIDPNGSVVRIFSEHGWSWGGDAWAWDSDPTTGYHDYMHFSYMGG